MSKIKVVMPYGRYAGVPVAKLQSEYLSWLLTVPGLPAELRRVARSELGRRGVPVPESSEAGELLFLAWARRGRGWRAIGAGRFKDAVRNAVRDMEDAVVLPVGVRP